MPRVFVSHSTQDRGFIEAEIIGFLEGHGVGTWYSRDDIATAAHWERNIVKGLKDCDWFLVVLSPRSAQSEWVRDEVHWAIQHRGEQIIPVLMEACNLEDFHLRMPRIQFVDFRADLSEARQRLLRILIPPATTAAVADPVRDEVHCLTGHAKQVECVAPCRDGRHIVSGSHDGTIRLWDLSNGTEVRRFAGHKGAVSSLAVSPDGQRLLSGSSDRTMRLWDLATGKELRRVDGFKGWVLCLAFAADGRHALSGAGDTSLRWWDLDTGLELRRFQAEPRGWVLSVALSSDGKFAITGTGNQWNGKEWVTGLEHAMRVWDVATGQLLRRL